MAKSPPIELTIDEIKIIVARMEQLVPVYTIGKSLADFTNDIEKLSARDLCDFTKCLRKLYRFADVAHEPYARPGDEKHLV